MNEIDKDKKEEEPDLFIGSSRRQQRNNKNINSSVNNNSKNQTNTLDEKSLALIKQLEKINLDELQNMNFNGLLSQIGDLSRENKILSDKIEQQNKTIAEINEEVVNAPELINQSPYEKGYLFVLENVDEEDFKLLMNAEQYTKTIEG